ncbi:MAG: hypothetical protein WCS70_09645 [Verrucomicrobiota bacterium]
MKKKKKTSQKTASLYSQEDLQYMALTQLIRAKERLDRIAERESLEQRFKHLSPPEKRFALVQYRQISLQTEINSIVRRYALLRRELAQLDKEILYVTADPKLLMRDPVANIEGKFGSELVEARESRSARVKEDKRLANAETPCLHCHKPFQVSPYKGPRQRYCNEACKMKAYRLRRKDKRAASRPVTRS